MRGSFALPARPAACRAVQRELHHRLNGLVEAIGVLQLDSRPGEGVNPHILPRTGRERRP
jgi:hypothetical protein